MSSTPAVVDLFSGPGGLSAGFENAGFNTAVAIDKSEPAVKTFDYNHDCKPILGDITELETSEILDRASNEGYSEKDLDVVIGGPPCKGFSLANMQTRSPDNPMNNLFYHFLRVVRDIDPKAVVMENVPGLLSMGKEEGQVKDIIVENLREMGYTVQYKILKAERYGVPQERRRVFFIGVKKGSPPFPSPTHNESGNQMTLGEGTDSLKSAITVGEAIMDLPELPAGGGGSDKMEYQGEPHSTYAEEMRENVGDTLYNHQSTVNRDKTVKRFKHVPQGGNWEDIPEELMDNYTDRSRTHGHIHYRLEEDKPSLTIANFRKSMMTHPTQNRLLTIREAARLQSFPDDYRFISDSISDKQQMVGDAVPVRLAEAIGEEIVNHLRQHHNVQPKKAKDSVVH